MYETKKRKEIINGKYNQIGEKREGFCYPVANY